jgi:hypothetical protein
VAAGVAAIAVLVRLYVVVVAFFLAATLLPPNRKAGLGERHDPLAIEAQHGCAAVAACDSPAACRVIL